MWDLKCLFSRTIKFAGFTWPQLQLKIAFLCSQTLQVSWSQTKEQRPCLPCAAWIALCTCNFYALLFLNTASFSRRNLVSFQRESHISNANLQAQFVIWLKIENLINLFGCKYFVVRLKLICFSFLLNNSSYVSNL